MGAKCVVRRKSTGDEFRLLRSDALVDMLAEVAVGPAVECALLHRGHVIGHQVVAKSVALVNGGPEASGLRLPVQAIRVSKATRENGRLPGSGIDGQDRGAMLFILHAVLRDIAIGADRHVKHLRAGITDDIFGPVVVNSASRKLGHYRTGISEANYARLVVEAQQRIRIGDVK
jgi:hypothetical protein